MGNVVSFPAAGPRGAWNDMSECEHAVQIYGDDERFLDDLARFASSGLEAGEGVVVLATAMHLYGVEKRLREGGVDVDTARHDGRYVPRLADDILAACLDGDWPDERRFTGAVTSLFQHARGGGRAVRAFSELVAVLWARGQHAATIHMELLWGKCCAAERVPVYCAYPRDTFSRNATESIVEICRIHSRVVPSAG